MTALTLADCRREILALAVQMEAELRANAHKPALREGTQELFDLLVEIKYRDLSPEQLDAPGRHGLISIRQRVANTTAGIAALAMMIARSCAALPDVSDPAADVLAERRRQVEVEGWTPQHDDMHGGAELAFAASTYALAATLTDEQRASVTSPCSLDNNATLRRIWPWERTWWKPKSRRQDLVRAGALIIAEVARIDRQPTRQGGAS